MEELIKAIVFPLIDDHEHVQIKKRVTPDHGTTTYVLTVAKQDMGRIIGKHGQVAEAVRSIISAVGNANGIKTRFLIRE
ncbi:KH domain-containing protein [Sporolactobacillus inulinus]|jgi:predicted RNA-binding protein YlqC (UPF0109 family)|uniref:KH domain RNA binding protein YlqC n=2 Tax=Sporolactobacillus inulinus TaxID=2078 RepID=A0A4Y3T226_9BACL|nr:KH domain-containing protein [Sporolactobacillus inulinus]KLI01863.1 hypothetical protein SINU_11280 [Sporolactobacillus inulinus CASD]GAY74506.1 KH domain RNA binding protein YlqC [Sporolactobacillus inulinus]GEB75879.1 UPF0109 protein [Sporolactobacillus inulinus]